MGRRRRWGQRLALTLALVLVATIAQVPTAKTPIAQAAVPASKPVCPVDRPDEVSALVAARLCGDRVQVASATSATSRTWALPSGQVQTELSVAPVRVRQDDGWVPVDLTLMERADGSVGPRAYPGALTLSGAQPTVGDHTLLSVGAGAGRVSVGWSGVLPAPELDGAQATYAEVLAGVDLVVQATRAGVETFYVVKSREAAARVARIRMPLAGPGTLTHRRDSAGNLTLLGADGTAVAHSPAPLMWDARRKSDTGEPHEVVAVESLSAARVARPAQAGARTGVKGAASGAVPAGVDVTLSPDVGFLTDPDTVYPVTIDPQLNPVSTTFDTYVKEGDSTDRSGANDLQWGVSYGNQARSFAHWNTEALRGKQVTSATVYFYNFYSQTCSAKSWEIWSTEAASTDTRWGSQPAWLTK